MALQEYVVTIGLRWRWWVFPLMRGAAIWHKCRLPVNVDRMAGWIARYGAKYTVC